MIGEDGRVATYSLADGSLIAEADLGFRLNAQERNYRRDFTETTVVDRVLYVARRISGRTSLAAYPVDTLRQRWRTTGGPVGAVTDCSPYLCVGDDLAVSALDAADGHPLWTDARWAYVYAESPGVLLGSDKAGEPSTTIIDPATGRAGPTLGPGTALGGSPLLYLRADHDSRTVRALTVDRADGTLRVIGDVGLVTPYRCSVSGDYLACPTIGGPTRVWHLPS
jgi:hypothetical protein